MPRYGKRRSRKGRRGKKRSRKGATGYRKRAGRVRAVRGTKTIPIATTRQNSVKLKFVAHQAYIADIGIGISNGKQSRPKYLSVRCTSIHDFMRENGGNENAMGSFRAVQTGYGQNVSPIHANGWDKYRLNFEKYFVHVCTVQVKFDIMGKNLDTSPYQNTNQRPIMCFMRKHSLPGYLKDLSGYHLSPSTEGLHAGNIGVLPNTCRQILYDSDGRRSTCTLSMSYAARRGFSPLHPSGQATLLAKTDHVTTIGDTINPTGGTQQPSHPLEQTYITFGVVDAAGNARDTKSASLPTEYRKIMMHCKYTWTVAFMGPTSLKQIGGPLAPLVAAPSGFKAMRFDPG